MKKEITNIFINSGIALNNNNATYDDIKLFSLNINIPPIVIKNKANLKVANICHTGSGHGDNIILFKIDGIQTDYNKYLANDGSTPTIIATTFNNARNLYEENDIPLIKQTINEIKLNLSTLNAITYLFNNSYTITNGGTGYLVGQIITFTDNINNILNASVKTVSTGAITALDIIYPSTFYFTSVPTLTTTINGSGASLTATISSGAISAITIVNAGVGYIAGQSLSFTGGGGTGANITIATVSATGAILTFTITNGGSNYTTAPIVSINSTTKAIGSTNITPVTTTSYGIVTPGILKTLFFCISLKIEEEVNE